MRIPFRFFRPLSAAGLLTLVACSGMGSPVEPVSASQKLAGSRAVTATGYAYVSDSLGNFVDVFDRQGNLVTKLTTGMSGPAGLFVDPDQNLWVANTSGSNVLVFAPGSTTPSRTLDDAGAYPADVVVGPDGTAYVSNISQQSGYGSIEIYPPGKNEPARALQDPNAAQNWFVALDARGNLFVTVVKLPINGQLGGRVDEYAGALQSGLKRLRMNLGAPGGIRIFDSRLLICDITEQTVREFTEYGRPTGRVLVTGGSWDGFDVNRTGDQLLGADQTYNEGIARQFPGENIRHVFRDSQFQYPFGAAYASSRGAH